MLAKDVMTTAVLTVTPDTDVGEIARTLLDAALAPAPVSQVIESESLHELPSATG